MRVSHVKHVPLPVSKFSSCPPVKCLSRLLLQVNGARWLSRKTTGGCLGHETKGEQEGQAGFGLKCQACLPQNCEELKKQTAFWSRGRVFPSRHSRRAQSMPRICSSSIFTFTGKGRQLEHRSFYCPASCAARVSSCVLNEGAISVADCCGCIHVCKLVYTCCGTNHHLLFVNDTSVLSRLPHKPLPPCIPALAFAARRRCCHNDLEKRSSHFAAGATGQCLS